MRFENDQPTIQSGTDKDSPEPEHESKDPSDWQKPTGGDEGSRGWRTPSDEPAPAGGPGLPGDPPVPGDEGSRGW